MYSRDTGRGNSRGGGGGGDLPSAVSARGRRDGVGARAEAREQRQQRAGRGARSGGEVEEEIKHAAPRGVHLREGRGVSD